MSGRMNSVEIFLLLLVLATFVVGLVVYPLMPERMASHWDASGRVNGEVSRPVGVFFFPCLLVVFYALFFAIPRIDPLRANIQQFRKAYNVFIFFLMLFFVMMYVHTLLWSAGVHLNTGALVGIGIAALMFLVGYLCRAAKRNYFVGIRTPWTLNSDSVWEKTHRIGSKLFYGSGVVILIGVPFPQYLIWFILVPIVGVTLFLVVYSYVVYEREARERIQPDIKSQG